ncbi:TPA: hypothetical protein EYP70_07450 [Candidatus Bathyarchaeota archaeon]|nr:hypothetical protein [Candidatus Bathyarchaeota archaeon]
MKIIQNLFLSRKATAVIASLFLITVFIFIAVCFSLVMLEYTRYVSTLEALHKINLRKAREDILVKVARLQNMTEITLINRSSITIYIVAIFIVNTTNGFLEYLKLDDPVVVPPIQEEKINLFRSVSTEVQLGVLTDLGNVFWEKI